MLKTVLITLAIVILFQVTWFAYERLSYRQAKPDTLDRIMITPGLMSWLMSVFCAALCILFLGMPIHSILTGEDVVFWILLGPPLGLLMGFGAYIIIWSRLRASGACVELRGIGGWQTIEWDNVIGVLNHSILGSRLHIRNRAPIPVWVHGSGSREVRELFDLYEKPFEP